MDSYHREDGVRGEWERETSGADAAEERLVQGGAFPWEQGARREEGEEQREQQRRKRYRERQRAATAGTQEAGVHREAGG